MALNQKDDSRVYLQADKTGKTTGTQSKGFKKRKRKSRDISIELLELAEVATSRDPHDLAREGELSQLKALIQAWRISIKLKDFAGATLLHAAASKDQVEVMEYLIECGIPLNATDSKGNTALHLATQNACINAVDLLLERQANDTILNQDLDASLHIAVRSNNLQLVQAFLRHPSVELVVHGYRKRTPLHLAAEHDLVEIVEAIHTAAKTVQEWKENKSFRVCAGDADNVTPIHYAARCGSHKVLDLMITKALEHGYPIEGVLNFLDEENSSPLHAAVDAGHLEVVKVLLKYGASPVCHNGDQLPPLHLACYQGRVEIVKAMVEKHGPGILHSTTSDGSTPLHWAAHSIHGACINRYLIQEGAPLNTVNREGRTALHNAIIFGSTTAIQELLKAGADAFAKDYAHCNVFHHAVLHNRKAALLVLLAEKRLLPMVHEPNRKSETPIHAALCQSRGDILAILIPAIQNQLSNQKDRNGCNYLHLAASSGDWRALGYMLNTPSAEHMLNETNHDGSTPLHVAAQKGAVQCLEMLLSQGAMIHKCHCGYTPFLCACANGHTDAAKVLFQAHPFQRNWTDDQGNTALHMAVKSGNCSTVQLCLNLGIPITHNQDGNTFLDLVINMGNEHSARAVIEHDRWQECLDSSSTEDSKHTFLRLVETMPDIAKAVLDRCHTKSDLPRENPRYWEEFDFKYLRLSNADLEQEDEEKSGKEDLSMALLSEEMMMKQSIIKYKGSWSPSGTDVSLSLNSQRGQGMKALRAMLSFKRIPLLTHPLVVRYLKMKWRKYGRGLFLSYFLLFILQVICLSVFIGITTPPRLNISADGKVLLSVNETIPEISGGSNAFRFITLILCALCTMVWVTDVLSTGIAAINITKHELLWVIGGAHAAVYAFLIPWHSHKFGLNSVIWEAGAVAAFLNWFSVVLFLEHFDVIGIYVTMFLQVFTTLIKVLFICLLFIIAFALTFYILLGEQTIFSNVSNSLFITFSYLLGEIDYNSYVDLEKNKMLQYPVLTFFFVLAAAVMLAVVVMNLLIGLAVGDIDKIRQNAIIKQRSDDVRFFTKLDNWLPLMLLRRFNVRILRTYPNEKVNVVRAAWRFLWRSFKGDDGEEDNSDDLRDLVEHQQRKLRELNDKLTFMLTTQQQQHEELRQMMETTVNLIQPARDDMGLSPQEQSTL